MRAPFNSISASNAWVRGWSPAECSDNKPVSRIASEQISSRTSSSPLDAFGLLVAEDLLAADHVQRQVSRSPHDPGGRVLRNAVKRPGLQRSGQRFLDHVFGQAQMLDAENSRQRRHQLSALVTEQVLHYVG